MLRVRKDQHGATRWHLESVATLEGMCYVFPEKRDSPYFFNLFTYFCTVSLSLTHIFMENCFC